LKQALPKIKTANEEYFMIDKMYKTNTLYIIIAFLLVLTSAGCYKDNEQTLYPSDCQTDHVSFSYTITLIINNNCVSCHTAVDGSGGISLATYTDIVQAAQGGKLLGAIKHESGFKAMPQDRAQLSDCTISQVEAWIQQGLLNN